MALQFVMLASKQLSPRRNLAIDDRKILPQLSYVYLFNKNVELFFYFKNRSESMLEIDYPQLKIGVA
jgi:hypothetical protein